MRKILLIKTGAAGDIVRTTVLLNAVQGNITWVVDKKYAGILPQNHPALERVLSVEEAAAKLVHEKFDVTISLEEDINCARLAASIPTEKITGIYFKDDRIRYSDDAAAWFDMSLVSSKGRASANELKWKNADSFQNHLFHMLGLNFDGEPYCIYQNNQLAREKRLIGIEARVGNRWPNKAWSGYPALVQKLEESGYTCRQLVERKSIVEYLDDIAACSFLVSGDTLAMHVALAYKIPNIAIFNCTSPAEIHDYGIMKKIVSPLLQQSFYSQEYSPEVVNSISPETVFKAFCEHVHYDQHLQKA